MTSLAAQYSKWDALEVEDEEEKKEVPPELPGAQLDTDREVLRRKVEKLLEAHGAPVDTGLVAYFVAAQRRDVGAPSNAARHVEIIELLSKRPALTNAATTEALCAAASERFEEKDNPTAILLVEAVNTLEAARRYDGALALFAAICTPTSSRAEAMREHYAKQTFGQLRLKRYMYRNLLAQDNDLEQVLRDHEANELANIDPPPPTPPTKKTSAGSLAARLFGWLFVPCAIVALVAYVHTSLIPRTRPPEPPSWEDFQPEFVS